MPLTHCGRASGLLPTAVMAGFSRHFSPARTNSPALFGGISRVLSLRVARQTVRRTLSREPRITEILNPVYEAFRTQDTSRFAETMDSMVGRLAEVRAIGMDAWRTAIESIRRHPVTKIFHEDPLTHRAFHRPHGHSCDAVMLDLICREPPGELGTEEMGGVGKWLWECTSSMTFAEAMRNRRDIIACQIDAIAESCHGAEVLAIESGHLREAARSVAVRAQSLRRFFALDHDSHAIAGIERQFARSSVNAIHTPTYALLKGAGNALGRFDLIYSSGLFLRLETKAAVRALTAMFEMLKPGGKLIAAGLAPTVAEAAYMEAFMDWWPVYRDAREMMELPSGIPDHQIISRRVFFDPTDNIPFLELTRDL